MGRSHPLAVRLALLLAGSVIVVLLVAGLLVNRVVSRSLDETLTAQHEERLGFAAAALDEAVSRDDQLGRGFMEGLLRRIARDAGGAARLLDASGDPVAEAGLTRPGAETEMVRQPLAAGGSLEIEVPRRQAGFLTAFNAALIVAGVLSVLAIVAIATVAANRLTRPLRGVAAAAQRVGSGDLAARASGGADRESAELAAAFNAMADRLQRSEMLRRRAASDVAHDLATPATVLESHLQAMVDGVVPADRGQLETARVTAGALSAVVRQLADLAGAEAAPLTRRPEAVELAGLLRDIVGALDGLLRERAVSATVSGSGAALVDRTHLGRALRNVVVNAIQHSPAGATVQTSVEAGPGAVLVRVRDQGPGISAADLPHVFERFYRADPARGGERAGSGIGLTIARELLAANGGSIEVETSGPRGSTFLLRLPPAAV